MRDQKALIEETGRLIALQLAAVAVPAGVAAAWGHWGWGKGLLFGGGLAALLAAMLSASLQAATQKGRSQGAGILYRGAVERFLLVVAAVVFAATVLELNIGAVVIGLIIAHVITFVEAARMQMAGRKPKDSGIGEQR